MTPYVGAAVKLAALDARRQMAAKAAQLWNLPIERIRFAKGKISANGHRALTWAEILTQSQTAEIVGVGASQSKRLWAEDASNQARDASTPGWPFGAQTVEVAVDHETGVIKLIRVASAHDIGKAINPMAVTSQIEGGIIMGLGYALSEGLLFDEGKVTNASFADYKIPTMRDIPAATAIIVEKNYSSEPYGAKGVGEMSVFGIAPAVANAVARLTGVRIKDLPLSAEKLREQLKESKEK